MNVEIILSPREVEQLGDGISIHKAIRGGVVTIRAAAPDEQRQDEEDL